MNKIILEIDNGFKETLESESQKHPDEISIVSSDKFDGDLGVFHALIILSTITIQIVGRIIIESIRSNKHVKIIYKGFEISGVSEENIMEILKDKLLDNEN